MKPGDLDTTRDYAEILSFKLDNDIMNLNFDNSVSLSMEGVSIRQFSKEKRRKMEQAQKVREERWQRHSDHQRCKYHHSTKRR